MAEFKELKTYINLRDIKSYFIIKRIFSFLNEKQKLNMIIYNKEIQKIFSVDIENYKKITEKYKIGERNGRGKEYNLKSLNAVFEGEYLNGKRNGKRKEFANSFNNNKI